MNSSLFSPRARRALVFGSLALMGGALTAEAASPVRIRQASARTLMRGFVGEPLAADSLRPAEQAFLTKAVEVSRQQLRLAEIGVSQATSSEVRGHAQQLVTDYRSLTASLEALIRRRGGIAGAPAGGTSEAYRKLVAKAGADFDREFIRTVGQSTNAMLTLFEQVASDSTDTDVRELAAAELPVLRGHRSEIVQLEKALD